NHYLQLSRTSLYLQVSVYNDKVLVSGDEVTAPINNFLHSLFSQVELSFNGQNFENSNNVYPYKAYITDLLNYGQDSKNSYLQSNLFYRDDAGRFDTIGTHGDANFLANSGYVKRNKILNNGNGKIELIGRLHCDIFNTDRYLINNVSMNLKLIPTRPEFCLMGDKTKSYYISVDQAILLVRKAQINPSVMLGHALALDKTTAKYPIKRVVGKQHTIGRGVSSKVITNISSTSLPSRVVIGFVRNSAYDGVLDQNPFNFGHFNLTKLNLMVDGQSSPYYKPLEFNFARNQYIRGYYSLFENIDKPVFAPGNDISREDYPNGYSLFAFDLTPDLCSGEQFNLIKTGNLDVGLTFADSLDDSIVVIFYLEYDNLVEINNKYEVSYDYKI
ncbi:unnamed protein product, partial [Brachionus calyciflorus]